MREILRDRAAPSILTAAWTLAHWDEPEYVETLISIAHDGRCARNVRDAALDALCELQAPEAIETLCEAIADGAVGETTRWICADALGLIGNTAALPALEAVAKEHPTGRLGDRVRDAIRAIQG
jgi:HEAT repeat protein